MRPNVLLIVCDQLSSLALRPWGGAAAAPQIEALAARGARLVDACCATPLCMPSRASFWTGRFPHETGVTSNGDVFGGGAVNATVAADAPTVGALFAAAGYRCLHLGKAHDAGALRGFHVVPSTSAPVAEAHPAWPLGDDTARDEATTAQAVAALADGLPRDAPWLLAVDLNDPHDICQWVGRNRDGRRTPMPPAPLPELPANFRVGDLARRPAPVRYVCCSHVRQSQAAGWAPDDFRRYLSAYHHYVARADDAIARVLAALAAREDRARTHVVLIADHGDALAARGQVTKQVCLYEEPVRVPFIVAGPGIRAGAAIAGPASLLDLLPTLAGLACLDAPRGWGVDCAPWLRGERGDAPHPYVAAEWLTEWGHTVEPARMIRTARWKYVRFREDDAEELYDLAADPGETRTLVDDPAAATALAEHRRLLDEHLRATGDPFATLAPRVDARWRAHACGYDRHVGCAAPEAAATARP